MSGYLYIIHKVDDFTNNPVYIYLHDIAILKPASYFDPVRW